MEGKDIEEFWCELFGHCYKFMAYKAKTYMGAGYYSNYSHCDWKCLKCGKEIQTTGEIAKDNSPKDGNIWLE